MRIPSYIVWIVFAAAACSTPTIKNCPPVECPGDEVCDGNGGCALPQQLDNCADVTACGDCSYSDRSGATIHGACYNGVCRPVACGDGIVGCGEVCDNGGDNNSCTTCSADCRSDLTCGNGTVDLCKGEQCDLGSGNADTPNIACRTDCQKARCGDGVVDDVLLHEACDGGSANSEAPDALCRTDCQFSRCGDGVVDILHGEICDDGNNLPNDGCSADCKSLETCGNGIVDLAAGEECDTMGVDTANCVGSTCKLSTCGDGHLNTLAGEQCDTSGVDTATCVGNSCQHSRCGDGYKNTAAGEQCDSSGFDSPSCIGATCVTSTCGDGYINVVAGEQCDSLGADTASCVGGTCKTSTCGDGYTNLAANEQCDSSGVDSMTCVGATCKTSRCGDSYTNTAAAEQCDSGGTDSATCVGGTCKLSSCGDGYKNVAAGEQCDSSGTDTATCVGTTCKTSRCGDGYKNTVAGEQCDSSGFDSPTCVGATCKTSRCGDGYTNFAAAEECDSNGTDTAACVGGTCKLSRCGDSYKNVLAGEQCDSGGTDTATCIGLLCKTSICGDGYLNALAGEQCDSGGGDTSTCIGGTCKTSRCGDGYKNVAAGEQCDSSGVDSATCIGATCKTSRCGDAYTNLAASEQCDSGGVDSATCIGATCKTSKCGDGYLNAAANESCDDSNTRGRDGCSSCKSEDAIALTPGVTPGARRDAGIAYDAARQRVVLFGGQNGGFLNDTWEWDGVSWTQMVPKSSPGVRSGHGMAYDPVRHRVIVFGGVGNGGNLADTWEWDGTNWTQDTPTNAPTPRQFAAVGWDANLKKILLYGGNTGTSGAPSPNSETWAWDGTNWGSITPGGTPPGTRYGGSMAFDSAHKYTLMYGGQLDSHVFTFDGTNWTDKGNQAVDLAQHMALAYDANRGAIVLWHASGTTWEWNGTSFAATAATTPGALDGTAMTYDAIRKQLVLFGGYNGPTYFSDTWLRSGTAWATSLPWLEPGIRMRVAFGYDPLRGVSVAYGGQSTWISQDLSVRNDETWEWDGRGWTLKTPTKPAALTNRAAGQFVYDTVLRTLVLFGGESTDASSARLGHTDLYTYDGTTYLAAPNSGGRTDHPSNLAVVYDAARDKLTTFGGRDLSTFTPASDSYTWNGGAGWLMSTPAGPPVPRYDTVAAYDPVRQRTVLYGGVDVNRAALGDVWEWDGSAWNTINATGPSGRKTHGMIFNPDAARVLLYGRSGLGSEDLWEWDGASWTNRLVTNPAFERAWGSYVYDAARHALVIFGGYIPNDGTCVSTTQILRYRPNAAPESCLSAIDYDNDGLVGCLDDECWSVCDPLHPPGTSRPAGAPFCGDGVCNGIEDCRICPQDCGTGSPKRCTGTCGDFNCDGGESVATCPNDC